MTSYGPTLNECTERVPQTSFKPYFHILIRTTLSSAEIAWTTKCRNYTFTLKIMSPTPPKPFTTNHSNYNTCIRSKPTSNVKNHHFKGKPSFPNIFQNTLPTTSLTLHNHQHKSQQHQTILFTFLNNKIKEKDKGSA